MRNKILNPKTGRYVDPMGKTGQKVLEERKVERKERKEKKKEKTEKKISLFDVSRIKLPKYILEWIDEEFKDLDLDEEMEQYDVAVFGSEHEIKNDKCVAVGVTHAAIIFYGPEDSYTFEWGNMGDTIGGEVGESNCYEYKTSGNIWRGGSPTGGLVKNITLRDVIEYSEKWKLAVGPKGGAYPKNCRGYVDSVLNGLLKTEMINWKQFR